jgi:ABC-type oligopeptide transport system substrate-binding subunit
MGTAAFPSSQFLPPALGIGVPLWKPAKSARAYLARAHYDRKHPFPRITLAVLRDPQLAVLAKKLQAAWHSALGLTIGVRQLNPSTYAAVLSNHAFDLAIVRWGADYPDPEDFLGTQLGKSPDNVTGWAGPKYVADVRLADSYDSRDPRRIALFARAATIAARKVPVLPLDEPAMTALVRPGLSAIRITPLGTVDGDWTQIRHQQTAD